jgi:ribosomal-protein-alanine N-acetyltransferase
MIPLQELVAFGIARKKNLRLETARLLLREWKRTDWKEVQEYAADPEVVRFMDWGPNTIDDTMHFVDMSLESQRAKPRTIFEFAVTEMASGKLIGGCGLRQLPHDKEQADVGYCFNRNFWKKGYATEACRRVVKFGFEELNLHRIYAICDAENFASAAVLKRSGMRPEAHFLKDRKVKGNWRDTLLLAVLREEWSKE